MEKKERISEISRKTAETDIKLSFNIDGSGSYEVSTGVPFLDHMLELFAKHGCFDLKIKATGDTQVDDHHSVEDVGICLGKALKEAVGDKAGIFRYGFMILPMDEALAEVALDFSGRPFLAWNVVFQQETIKTFQTSLVEEFWRAVAVEAGLDLHVTVKAGKDAHHVSEAIFKAAARAMRSALSYDPRNQGIPSTKGSL
ncbi:imidazoleglycerol-phosphate dehydratase HisB [bacterium]|nr:imidazoleglycerol-phosphate dehydratase HisB [bacterium]